MRVDGIIPDDPRILAKASGDSEFHDNNRAIQFVQNEERIRAEMPDSNKRAYYKVEYKIDGGK